MCVFVNDSSLFDFDDMHDVLAVRIYVVYVLSQQLGVAAARAAAAAMAAVVLLLVVSAPPSADAHVVVIGAYNTTCPQAEDVVLTEMTAIVAKSPDLAAAVLRLFSVHCFVGGCEGSILLDSTAGNTAEKDAPLNQGVRGYEVVDAIKAKLDAACPGVVSCADTLALAARDFVRLTKGPFILLPTGRRDGNRSVAADVALNSPPPGANITDIIAPFAKKFNLTAKDVAVLSGAHTIGKARCSTVSPRLYSLGGQNGASDPTLDANYTVTLRGQCKPGDNATLVYLDPPTQTTFDKPFHLVTPTATPSIVAGNKGLLSTDAALLLDATTSAYVARQANATAPPGEFFADFATSFVAMSKLGVLTHHNGEIRQVFSKVNPPSPSSSTNAAAAKLTATGGLAVALVL
ncbi:peroxidase 1-like [Miscanthus floridulus]|uniref:peroxidase 1-like n=1 Tax=Miscanthus floridulus TaxID=154761 RepID=UPI003457DC98